MKTKALKIVLFVMVGMLLFASCGSKKYAGFEVKKDYIMLTNPENNSTFSFPLDLYKLAESELQKVVDDFNSFDTVSESSIDRYEDISYAFYNLDIYDIEDYADYTQESLEEITSDSKLVNSIIESLKKAPEEDLETMDEFCYAISDIMDEFLYALEELYDYNNDDSWYDTKEEIFEEYVSDFEYDGVIEIMEFFFPNISIETDFSKTPGSKTDKVVNDLTDALDAASDLYDDLDIDSYTDALDAASDLYDDLDIDGYDDALESYGDALDAINDYADVLNSFSF